MHKTYTDDDGLLRLEVDERHQFLAHIPTAFLDPWASYDSWDASLAVKLITIGYNLDIQAYVEDAKRWPQGSTGKDAARALVQVYERGIAIAQSSIAAGLLTARDTPANWLAWAKRKGYDVTHLEAGSHVVAERVQPVQRSASQDAEILLTLREDGFNPKGLPKNEPGKMGVKSTIRKKLSKSPLFVGDTVFNKAWERLRRRGEIADG